MSVVRHRRSVEERERARERQISMKTMLTVINHKAKWPAKKDSSRGNSILRVLETERERIFSRCIVRNSAESSPIGLVAPRTHTTHTHNAVTLPVCSCVLYDAKEDCGLIVVEILIFNLYLLLKYYKYIHCTE